MKKIFFIFLTVFFIGLYYLHFLSPKNHLQYILDNAVFTPMVITPYGTFYTFDVNHQSRVLYSSGTMYINNKKNTIEIKFNKNYRYLTEEKIEFDLNHKEKYDLRFLSNIK